MTQPITVQCPRKNSPLTQEHTCLGEKPLEL